MLVQGPLWARIFSGPEQAMSQDEEAGESVAVELCGCAAGQSASKGHNHGHILHPAQIVARSMSSAHLNG
jgi:hypothetical protein